MRIQHNITAMAAYRNYTNNTSAVAKNLEKLSSGYKINRAGDDAAGLAVSEKMRAQITGLEAAQKNAKDGISLVQTAEGALTEVHDMLNRMYELAELASNGTYDDEVDRANYQKEIDSLSTEINRIADSVNFNGINLLDGSLSKEGVASVAASFDLPDVGTVLGTNTVLHQGAGSGAAATTLSLDLHNTKVSGIGTQFDIEVGGTKLTGTLLVSDITGEDIVKALADGDTDKVTFEVGGAAYDKDAITFGGGSFKATSGTGTRVSFEQTDTADVTPNMDVTISSQGTPADPIATITTTAGTDAGAAPTLSGTLTTANQTQGNAGSKGSFDVDFAGCSLSGAGAIALTFAGQTVTSDDVAAADAATASKLADAFAGKTMTIDGQTFTATVSGTTVTFTAGANAITTSITGNATATTTPPASAAASKATTTVDFTGKTGADVIGSTITIGDKTYEFVETAGDAAAGNTEIVIAQTANDSAIATALNGAATGANVPTDASASVTGSVVTFTADNTGAADTSKVAYTAPAGTAATLSGDYNKATTVLQKKSDAANERLASTYFSLTDKMVGQGASVKIGNENYVFKTDKKTDPELGANGVKVDISDLDAEADDYLVKVAERLTKAAENNTVYTVGHDGNRITVTETVDHAMLNDPTNYPADNFDLTTLEGIADSLGFASAAKDGKALTLQIGDTADDFNKLSVSVSDCHTAAMGIGSINISTQDGASDAMAKIKSAINYVSSTRGDLGATQNRLEHTINNLSVMQENIQDAESTIRDVDIAQEMMAYTKNNILVQSAQAMLAQANQLPQGVLQLLQ